MIESKVRCSCGERFELAAIVVKPDGEKFRLYMWCPSCDAHASGCLLDDHDAGKCVVPLL